MSSRRQLEKLTDTELLDRTRLGQAEAFEPVFRRNYRVVLSFFARRVAEPELAADLLAETFAALLIVVRNKERALPQNPVGWLLLTARHLLVDSYRHGQVEDAARRKLRMEPLILEDHDLARVEAAMEEAEFLDALTDRLPHDQLEALRARILEERDYGEIARQLHCSQAVVRKRVSRAMRTLRNSPEVTSHA